MRKNTPGKERDDPENESRLHEVLLDSIPCIALILRKHSREIVACNAIARQLGAVVGKTCFETIARAGAPCYFCKAPELWATGERQRVEAEYLGKFWDGIWERYTDELYVHYIFDITERKRAEKALKESEEKYREVVEGTADLITQVDERGAFTYVNPVGERIFGLAPVQMIGMSAFDFTHPDDREATVTWFDDITSRRLAYATIENRQANRTTGDVHTMIWTSKFNYGQNGEVTGVNSIAHDITGRKRSEDKIKKALVEKETLLREIHHRVKNNMQVITSLLNLQARKIRDPQFRKAFEESEQRIKTMALVHERLYQKEDLSGINFSGYIHSLIRELKTLYRIDERKVVTKITVADVVLDIDSAIPCGLIINELITNCFKYAFPENRSGEVIINFTRKDNTYNLTIRDNGVGLPAGFDYRQTVTLGMQLVRVLTKQLLGTLYIRTDGGTEAVITFTKKERTDGKEENTD